MDCPHCNQALAIEGQPEPKLLTCEACGQKALPGSNFCHACGKELPAPEGPEPKLLTCGSCGREAPAQHQYCAQCGEPLGEESHDHDHQPAEGFDPNKRVACSDGMCIGIMGPDGKCTECGKPLGANPDNGQED